MHMCISRVVSSMSLFADNDLNTDGIKIPCYQLKMLRSSYVHLAHCRLVGLYDCALRKIRINFVVQVTVSLL